MNSLQGLKTYRVSDIGHLSFYIYIENQCYVLAVNRTGSDPSCNYDGGTAVVGPSGEMLASVPDNTAGCCSAQLDIKGLAALRRDFPVLDDADAFTLLP